MIYELISEYLGKPNHSYVSVITACSISFSIVNFHVSFITLFSTDQLLQTFNYLQIFTKKKYHEKKFIFVISIHWDFNVEGISTSELHLLFINCFNRFVQHIFYFDNEDIIRKGYKSGLWKTSNYPFRYKCQY